MAATSEHNSKKIDVLIVGAGFGGMYMLHSLNKLGLNSLILEQGELSLIHISEPTRPY